MSEEKHTVTQCLLVFSKLKKTKNPWLTNKTWIRLLNGDIPGIPDKVYCSPKIWSSAAGLANCTILCCLKCKTPCSTSLWQPQSSKVCKGL